MQQLTLNQQPIDLDDEGYLLALEHWSPDLADYLAKAEGLVLTEAHWELIYLVRDFYQRYQQSPAMRPLVKATAQTLGADKGKSIYLMSLFPGSPAKRIARLAGLPKPDNCL